MVVNTLYPTDFQMHLFHEGNLFQGYQLFGSHVLMKENQIVTRFCVWAPNAQIIRLVGDFNNWNGTEHSFHRVNKEGIWMLIVPENLEGCLYKYEVIYSTGERCLKADPFAFYSEIRPNTASIVYCLDGYQWMDSKWQQKREKDLSLSKPVVIYELHLGSWKKHNNGQFLSYKELVRELIPYVLQHGFTHIELLPLVEHPLDDSWGYQGTGYFSPTSRYGEPHDLMYFIDQCHQNGIGVILDWVPGHFCKDGHGLYQFDGTHLYSYEYGPDRENDVWGTANFDLGKPEVNSFLISNVLFWMEYFHIDGFRLDAVANIIYWPNAYEKKPNPFGIAFLKKLNQVVKDFDPSVMMIAEDSTDWPQVTAPTKYEGLGFQYKWNMGWMNDILEYMVTPANRRSGVHQKITFSLVYAFTENFVLPFSHDEVVHGKRSILNKMPGDYWQKFAQVRLLLGYMFAHPGKKLLFMGFELGQFDEWKDKEQLDWQLIEFDMHRKLNAYVKELIRIYKRSKPFYELDYLQAGFEWIDVHNCGQSIFSFIRRGKEEEDFLIIVCNFTEKNYSNYKVGVPGELKYRELFNSDQLDYGGSGHINRKILMANNEEFHGQPYHIKMNIAPFGISILRPVKSRKERKGSGKEKMRSYASGRGKRE
ncbi:1,4-alpha-glucan branching enzyme [Bacillus sp. CGMCC 1.16607]|uniref:1,4-alpha-glucan branching enzyme n=1 Tax=Bacillus sp. CGMCC 1.16607 TaxID=3351842 RepID=UPI0036354F0A